jgi:hypothetical protein
MVPATGTRLMGRVATIWKKRKRKMALCDTHWKYALPDKMADLT